MSCKTLDTAYSQVESDILITKSVMRTVQVNLPRQPYDVLIGPQCINTLGALIEKLNGVQRVALVADATVAKLHLAQVCAQIRQPVVVVEFPPGEPSKSIAQAEKLYDRLSAGVIERSDLIVTLGGGVAGDLGGFVAATWLRGVRYIQVPTTLEAAIDASVGGKTAVNHRSGKNLIGAFHQPSAVIIDVELLATLPQRDFVAGLAESVKHAAIRDAAFLAWHETEAGRVLAGDAHAIEELIARNVAIKASVVVADEREARLRQVLNYGHTIGHALEHVLGYELRHGECVALGMLAENEIALGRKLLSTATAHRIARLIETLRLPTRLPRAVDRRDVMAAMRSDKKSVAGAPTFVVIAALGEPRWLNDVADREIEAALSVVLES